jgi:hypothetical protein
MSTALTRLQSITFQQTTDKKYETLQQYLNVTSYSILDVLHACPRKFQLIKARAASGGTGSNNVNFAFGHSVGAGVAALLASNFNLEAGILNAMLAWRLPYIAAIPPKKKSITDACFAVQSYADFHQSALEDWKIWTLPNGKPALELAFSIDFENGYKHYGHIDVILEHKTTGKLAIQENKTSGFREIETALYQNSNQALSYSILIDMLTEETSYEVFYCVYSTLSREWQLLPFSKTTSLKAEWLLDAQLDHAAISTYQQINFFPKRGESCYSFMSRCEFFNECNMTFHIGEPIMLPKGQEAERVDFAFTLSQIKARQHQRNSTES